jgi:hypothetical protein
MLDKKLKALESHENQWCTVVLPPWVPAAHRAFILFLARHQHHLQYDLHL